VEDETVTLKKSLANSMGSDYLHMTGSVSSLHNSRLSNSSQIPLVTPTKSIKSLELRGGGGGVGGRGEGPVMASSPNTHSSTSHSMMSSSAGNRSHSGINSQNVAHGPLPAPALAIQPTVRVRTGAQATLSAQYSKASLPPEENGYDTPLKQPVSASLSKSPPLMSSPVKSPSLSQYSPQKGYALAKSANVPTQNYDNRPPVTGAKVVAMPPEKEQEIVATQAAIGNMYTDVNEQPPRLSRLLSASLNDLSTEGYANDEFGIMDDDYTYADSNKTSQAWKQAAVNHHQQSPYSLDVQIPPSLDDLYARPMSRAMRKSVSLDNILEDNSHNSHDSRTTTQRQVSKISQKSSGSSSATSPSPQVQATIKGISFTPQSKSFRRVQPNAQPQVELRRQLSGNPNSGRRLPSLPPLSVKPAKKTGETVC
jgi:hypothetical protein